MLMHTGKRPYACGLCQQSFLTKFCVKLYYKKHHDGEIDLHEHEQDIKHMLTHTTKKTYACEADTFNQVVKLHYKNDGEIDPQWMIMIDSIQERLGPGDLVFAFNTVTRLFQYLKITFVYIETYDMLENKTLTQFL